MAGGCKRIVNMALSGLPAAQPPLCDHVPLPRRRRLINLELLLKFGPDAWRVRNETLTVQCEALKRRLAAVKKETEDLNRSRKLSQLEAGRQLSSLQAEYTQLVAKNAEIEAACLTLESQAAALGDKGGGDSDASMVEATA